MLRQCVTVSSCSSGTTIEVLCIRVQLTCCTAYFIPSHQQFEFEELSRSYSKFNIGTSIDQAGYIHFLAKGTNTAKTSHDYMVTTMDPSYFTQEGFSSDWMRATQGDMMLISLVALAKYAQQRYKWRSVDAAERGMLAEPRFTTAIAQSIVLLLAKNMYYQLTGYTVGDAAVLYSVVLRHYDSIGGDAHGLASAVTLAVLCISAIVVAAIIDALLGLGTVTVVLQGDAPPVVLEPVNAVVAGGAGAVTIDDGVMYYDARSELQPGDEVNDGVVRRRLALPRDAVMQRAHRAELRVAELTRSLAASEQRVEQAALEGRNTAAALHAEQNTNADLRAELAAMRERIDQLAQQVAQLVNNSA
jgi:hypothetical protein